MTRAAEPLFGTCAFGAYRVVYHPLGDEIGGRIVLVARHHVMDRAYVFTTQTGLNAIATESVGQRSMRLATGAQRCFLSFSRVVLAHAMLFIGQDCVRVYTLSAIVPSE